MSSSPSLSVILVLNCTKSSDQKIGLGDLDAQSWRFVQKDGIFTQPTPMSVDSLASLLKTDGGGYMYNDDVADFVSKILVFSPIVPTELVNSNDGHRKPSMVAEPVDSTALGNLYGTFAELLRGVKRVPIHPDSSRESVLTSAAGIGVTVGGLKISCNEDEPLSERLFSFIKEPFYDNKPIGKGDIDATEILGKQNKDTYPKTSASNAAEILHALSRRNVARAKNVKQTRKKNTIAIMFLLCITAFIWSAEARDYPGGGSQSASVTSFENRQALEDTPKLLYSCGYPCCGVNYHGPCNRCCPKGVQHIPSPTTNVKEAGNGGADGQGGGNGHN